MAYQEHLDAATQKIAGAANNAAEGAASAADKLQSGAAKAADKLQNGADSVRREVVSRASDLSDQAADAVKKLGVDPTELRASMDDAWDALEQRFRDLVRQRPIRAVIVSAAVGVLLGFLSRG